MVTQTRLPVTFVRTMSVLFNLIRTLHSRPHSYPTNFPHITLPHPPTPHPTQLRHLSYLHGQRTGKLGRVLLFSVHISPSPLVSAITSLLLHPLDHLPFVAVKNSIQSWKMIIARGANFHDVTIIVITLTNSCVKIIKFSIINIEISVNTTIIMYVKITTTTTTTVTSSSNFNLHNYSYVDGNFYVNYNNLSNNFKFETTHM